MPGLFKFEATDVNLQTRKTKKITDKKMFSTKGLKAYLNFVRFIFNASFIT